ncbi:MAG: TolC family protein [Planctomycetota bacterium]|nr:TolC family protein [Planctomycetota bacterium]MDA1113226.1 TolC family protein [Planctomycetota bacterium]
MGSLPTKILPLCTALLLAGGCATPGEHIEDADDQVYALLDQRRGELFEKEPGFRVDRSAEALRAQLLENHTAEDQLELNILQALEIGAENSREFQDQRESLYRTALDLTLERWRFSWQSTLSGSAGVSGNGENATTASVDADLGVSKLFGSGALVLGNIGTTLLRAIDRGDGWDAIQDLSLSFTLPLLRGSAREVVLEPLTQAERDLVYSVRSYERFRHTFAVVVIDGYYGLLLTLDSIINEQANYESLKLLRIRNQRLAEAGNLTDIQVDQAQQDELRSESRLLQLHASYSGQVDQFAILLGLPAETNLILDRAELDGLKSLDGAEFLSLDATALGAFALENRLDLMNLRGQEIDAERRTRVAADALRLGMDLQASVNGRSQEGQPFAYKSSSLPWSFALGFDFPIDQLPERNAYRLSLLNRDRAVRSLEQSRDNVLAGVYDNFRQTESTSKRYVIQLSAVELADKRVRSAVLKLEAGRSSTRDVLEAQEDLLSAQNAATSALIDFALARLRLYRDLELLDVDASGILLDASSLPYATETTP